MEVEGRSIMAPVVVQSGLLIHVKELALSSVCC
jgi:hypothetical protein